jgi:hypothetical protein
MINGSRNMDQQNRKEQRTVRRGNDMLRLKDRDAISPELLAAIESTKKKISAAFADTKRVRASLKA